MTHKTLQRLALAVSTAAVVGVLSSLQFWVNCTMEGTPVNLGDVMLRHVPSWMSWGFMAPAIWALGGRWSLRGRDWKGSVARHLALSLVLSIAHRPLHVWFAWYPFWGQGPPWDFVRDYSFFSLFTDIALYWAIVGAETVFAQRASLREEHLRAAQLQTELARTRLSALEQQLRPHFLFNTLHALQSLQTDGRMAQARDLVDHLAQMLRHVFQKDAQAEIPVREELRLVEPYLSLMQVRYGERLQITQQINARAADGLVPRLILLPLLENAFLHAIDERQGVGHIELRAHIIHEQLVLEVRDDGPGPGGSMRQGSGLGVSNVRERLHACSGSRAECRFLEGPDGGCTVQLRLPYRVEVGELVTS